ncbi:MAG: hypothetical protein U5L95_02130 [Candidatus Saccharibacteria bacterium]|nr:hypothetical protein [Candidatus Saccharibacteria bacterium]
MPAPPQILSEAVRNQIVERQDFGAGIATLGCFKMMHDQPEADPYTLDIKPNLSM